jgi:predicted transposase YbfD/YdcC
VPSYRGFKLCGELGRNGWTVENKSDWRKEVYLKKREDRGIGGINVK